MRLIYLEPDIYRELEETTISILIQMRRVYFDVEGEGNILVVILRSLRSAFRTTVGQARLRE